MSRYFFDVEAGGRTVDEDGTVLADSDAIAVTASRLALDVARLGTVSENIRHVSIVVRDEAGKRIHVTELTIKSEWTTERQDLTF